MPSLTKPCPGRFAETTQLSYRENPSQAMQQEFACIVCGQTVGLSVSRRLREECSNVDFLAYDL